MQELKPCPFCGCTPYRYISHDVLQVGCISCGIKFSNHVSRGCEADEQWNRRVETEKGE